MLVIVNFRNLWMWRWSWKQWKCLDSVAEAVTAFKSSPSWFETGGLLLTEAKLKKISGENIDSPGRGGAASIDSKKQTNKQVSWVGG